MIDAGMPTRGRVITLATVRCLGSAMASGTQSAAAEMAVIICESTQHGHVVTWPMIVTIKLFGGYHVSSGCLRSE